MLTENEILSVLDNVNSNSFYSHFLSLGNPYSYLIDCRLNIFCNDNDQWAIAAERLGFNPRAGLIELEIYYYGNCLVNLEIYNDQISNYYSLIPINEDSFNETTDGFSLYPESQFWLLGNKKIVLSTNKQDYIDNGIVNVEPDQVSVEEAARLAIITTRDLFRATDEQLYKSIPKGLCKILVLDEWYHKDFIKVDEPKISENIIKQLLSLNIQQAGLDFDTIKNLIEKQVSVNNDINNTEWIENRPGAYETWQQIAKVIVNKDKSFYRPTLKANTHWKNWPESGSL